MDAIILVVFAQAALLGARAGGEAGY